jgi:hypothetical protein
MPIISNFISKLKNKTKNFTNEANDLKKSADFLNHYKKSYTKLRGLNSEIKQDIQFDKQYYNQKLKIFLKFLKDNEYDFENKNIIISIGGYSENKRSLFKDSGIQNPYSTTSNSEIFENKYLNWDITPDFINFDISQELSYIDSGLKFEKSGIPEILDSIKNMKENSKISSVIVKLNCNLFFNEEFSDNKILKDYYNNVFKIILLINKKFEYKIPIYFMITEIEEIFGFDHFIKVIPVDERNQILGISNTAQINEPYSEENFINLIEQFKYTIKDYLSKKIKDYNNSDDYKNIILFMNNLFLIIDNISKFCKGIFNSNTINNANIMAGIYACGYEHANFQNPPIGIEKYSNLISEKIDITEKKLNKMEKNKLYFFRDFIQNKIVKDFIINIPSTRLIKRNKIGFISSIVSFSFTIIITPIFYYAFYNQTKNSSQKIEYIFNNLKNQINEKESEIKSNIDSSKINLTHVLNLYKYIDIKKNYNLSSFYSPLTKLSNFDQNVKNFLENLVIVFEVRPIKNIIKNKLIEASNTKEYKDSSTQLVETSYENLIKYINKINFLEKSVHEYNSYGNSLNVDKLNVIYQKLEELDLSDVFPKTNIVIDNAERRFNLQKINLDDFKADISIKLERIFKILLNSIENEYIINENSVQLISYIDSPRKNTHGNNYYEFLKKIDLFINNISNKIDLYNSSKNIITASGNELKLDKISQSLKNSIFLDPKFVDNIDIMIKDSINKRNQNVLNYNSVVLGPLFEKADEKSGIKLSKSLLNFKNSLLDLNKFELIEPIKTETPMNEKSISKDIFNWINIDLDSISKNIDSYNKYMNEKITLFPEDLRPYVQNSILTGLNEIIINEMNNPQKFGDKNVNLDNEINTLIRRKDSIIKVLSFYKNSNFDQISQDISKLTFDKLNIYLGHIKNLAEKNIHYEPLKENFDWWDGVQPPALEAYNVYETRELIDYVSKQNQIMENLLIHSANPIMDIANETTIPNDSLSANFRFWKEIKDEMESKEKTTSYKSLNDTILVTLTTLNADNCMQDIPKFKRKKIKNDFFTLQEFDILNAFEKRCKIIYQNGVSFEYNKLVSAFNENLAGKFPFVDDKNIDKSEDVDESSLKDFFEKFDKFTSNEAAINYIDNNNSEYWKQPKEFIERMKNISSFMKLLNFSDSTNNPTLNVSVDFNRQKNSEVNTFGLLEKNISISGKSISSITMAKSIPWSPSEEIKVSFRWAKDYNQTPSLSENINNDKYYNVLNDKNKTVSFTARNKWSLIYLIRKNSMGKNDYYYSQNLLFKIPIKSDTKSKNDENIIENNLAKIILKLKFIDQSNKTAIMLPVFPSQADSVRIQKF